jgi:hypothetical protein
MASRAAGSSSHRSPQQQPGEGTINVASPAARVGRRQSIAASLHQQEREEKERETIGTGRFEMQEANNNGIISRLQTMGVVQKLNKAALRSKIEVRILLVEKLSIFFAAVGLALSIIEQETLW